MGLDVGDGDRNGLDGGVARPPPGFQTVRGDGTDRGCVKLNPEERTEIAILELFPMWEYYR